MVAEASALRIRRALVTGGAGLIGSYIVDQLLGGGDGVLADEVVVLDDFSRGRRENLESALRSGKVRLITGDIRDRDTVRTAMEGAEIVFHQAAIRITRCAEEPRLALEIMVEGAFNVFEEAARAGVQKVVAASSASVYGMAEVFPTPEHHHAYDNRTLYGAAKLFNEGMLRSFHDISGLRYVALRYFNVYGPRMDVHGAYTEVLVRWMERIEAGQPPLVMGDGSQTMDFIYAEDVARANLLAARSAAVDDVYNVASGTETSLNDLARQLLQVMGSELAIEYGPARKVNPVPRRLAEVSRARRDLGFEASVTLEEGLRRLVAWWRSERALAAQGEAAHG